MSEPHSGPSTAIEVLTVANLSPPLMAVDGPE